MASFYGASRSISSQHRGRAGLVGIVSVLRAQREQAERVTPAAADGKPGPLKMAILAARAQAGLDLFPEGR